MIAPNKTDIVGEFITKMKNETSSVKLNQQLYAIPKRINDLLNEQVFEYYVSDRRRRVVNPATEVCISIDNVQFFSMISSRYRQLQDSITPVIDLIEYHRIYPFMLFLNGRFIPLENIDLIASYEKYYLLIHDLNDELIRLVRQVDYMDAISLPSNIIYSIGVNNDGLTSIFSFNDMGLYDSDEWTHNIYLPTDEIGYDKFVGNTKLMVYTDKTNMEYFKENFFFFKDGLYTNMTIDILSGYVYIADEIDENTVCIFLNNPDSTASIMNITKASYDNIEEDIAMLLTDPDNAPIYIKTLSNNFGLSMDRALSYETNRSNALEYIMSYRTELFVELYEKELDYFSMEVDLEWLQNHTNEDGYLAIPRRASQHRDYYVIMMVNGELYEYYKHHFYKASEFICPITGIEPTDKVELLFFKDAVEYTLTNTIYKDDPYLPLNEYYYNNKAKIFCKQTNDTYFEFPLDGDQHFPVSYTLAQDDKGYSKIVYDDEFYYGKEVTITPDNTFRYFGFIMTEDDTSGYKVSLGTKFNYCNEYDRYLVFHNGRRLNNDFYRLTLPCRSTTPFYKFEIYLTIPLDVDDRLDVFYLPTKIKDIDLLIDLPTDGKVTIDKTKLPYILDENIYTFWINGKKIPPSDLKIVDSTTVQILNDQQSTSTFRITAMGNPIDEIEKVYQKIDQSLWDKAISEGNYTSILNIIVPTLTNTEPSAYDGNVPVQSIMFELFREHYMNNEYVDITGNFIYDYQDVDTSILEGEDPEGNSLIDAANAERRDNLDIERYYP